LLERAQRDLEFDVHEKHSGKKKGAEDQVDQPAWRAQPEDRTGQATDQQLAKMDHKTVGRLCPVDRPTESSSGRWAKQPCGRPLGRPTVGFWLFLFEFWIRFWSNFRSFGFLFFMDSL